MPDPSQFSERADCFLIPAVGVVGIGALGYGVRAALAGHSLDSFVETGDLTVILIAPSSRRVLGGPPIAAKLGFDRAVAVTDECDHGQTDASSKRGSCPQRCPRGSLPRPAARRAPLSLVLGTRSIAVSVKLPNDIAIPAGWWNPGGIRAGSGKHRGRMRTRLARAEPTFR